MLQPKNATCWRNRHAHLLKVDRSSFNWLFFIMLSTELMLTEKREICTVKPVLVGHCIKQTPPIKWTVAKVPKFISLIYCTLSKTFIKQTPPFKQMWTPKKYLKWSFLLLPTCIKQTLVIKFHHPTWHQKYERLPPTNFSIFTFKNITWQTYLISFTCTVRYCFLFHFVCIELVSLI